MAVLVLPCNVVAIPVNLGGAPSLAVVFGIDGAGVVSPTLVFEGKHAVGPRVGTAYRCASRAACVR